MEFWSVPLYEADFGDFLEQKINASIQRPIASLKYR